MYRPLTRAIMTWGPCFPSCLLHGWTNIGHFGAVPKRFVCMQGLTWGLHHAAAGHGHARHHAHACSGRDAHAHAHAVLTQGVRPQRGAHRLGLYRKYALPTLPPDLRRAWQEASQAALPNLFITSSGLHEQIRIADLAQEERL